MKPSAEDMERHKHELDQQGYTLVQGALPLEAFDELREAVVRVAAEEITAGNDYVYEDGSNQRIWVLLNKGRIFEDLVQNEVILQLMSHALGPGFLLSNVNANIAGPGGKPMFLHSDTDYVPPPFPPYPLVANAMWCLDDFTDANGATRIVPMSHELRRPPNYGKRYETVAIEAPRGTTIVFHGSLWHQTGANVTTDQKRHGIITYYCRPFLRQQENFFVSLKPEVLERATPRLKQLLGYTMWLGGVGAINGLPREGPRF